MNSPRVYRTKKCCNITRCLRLVPCVVVGSMVRLDLLGVRLAYEYKAEDMEVASFSRPLMVDASQSQSSTGNKYQEVFSGLIGEVLRERTVKDVVTVSVKKRRRRLFLGIFEDPKEKSNLHLRTVIRQTYLKEHMQPINICPYGDMPDDCDIAYAFIHLQPLANTTNQSNQDAADVLLLPNEGVKNPLWAMYRYLLELKLLSAQTAGKVSKNVRFDFVAHTWNTFLLYPDRLWLRELFDSNGDSIYDAYPRIFSWGVSSSSSIESQLKARIQDGGYRLLSATLVARVWNHDAFHRKVPSDKVEKVFLDVVQDIVQPAEILARTQLAQDIVSRKTNGTAITVLIPIHDAVLRPKKQGQSTRYRIAEAWDAYRDAELVQSYRDPSEIALMTANTRTDMTTCRHGPRMLLGILSVLDDDKEIQRRQAIRQTYLNFYNRTEHSTELFRICTLHELLNKNHPDHRILLKECQLVYTFVVGGNTTGPTERMEYSVTEPMTLASPASEPDVAVLNIAENMNYGKAQTYFKYATMLSDDNIYFDYIAKTDSDTIFYVDKLLDFGLNTFPKFPDNGRTYGGGFCLEMNSQTDIDGVIYFAGSFYFMSPDMTRFITSDDCDRKRLDVFAEDWSIGRFVAARSLVCRRIRVEQSCLDHPIKDVGEYRARWQKYTTAKN